MLDVDWKRCVLFFMFYEKDLGGGLLRQGKRSHHDWLSAETDRRRLVFPDVRTHFGKMSAGADGKSDSRCLDEALPTSRWAWSRR